MQEKIKEILDKIPFTLFYVLWAAWLGWDLYQFEKGPDSPVIQKEQEYATLEKTESKLQERKKKLADFRANLEKERTELQTLTQKLSSTQETLSAEVNADEFLKMVNTEARRWNLTVITLKPGKRSDSELYVETTFELSFKGLYVSVLRFLDQMSSLKTIVRVDQVDLKPVKPSNPGQNQNEYVELTGSLELKTYAYRQAAPKPAPKSGGT